jgi:hypothetical protein
MLILLSTQKILVFFARNFSEISDFIQDCLHFTKNYESRFHTKSYLKREMQSCYEDWIDFQKLLFKFPIQKDSKFCYDVIDDMKEKISGLISRFPPNGRPLFYGSSATLPTVSDLKNSSENSDDWQSSRHVPTAFCTPEELNKVNFLRVTVEECVKWMRLIKQEYLHMESLVQKKSASAGNRKNLDQLNSYLEFFGLMVWMIMLRVEDSLVKVDENSQQILDESQLIFQCVAHITTYGQKHLWRKAALCFCGFIGDTQQYYEELSHRDLSKFKGKYVSIQ